MAIIEGPIGIKKGSSRVVSKALIEISDLLSEGEIDGPVSVEYVLAGTAGNTGWSTVIARQSVPTFSSSGFLNSIYLNDIPILSKEGLFNFQDIQLAKSNGSPNGEFSSSNLIRTETKKTIVINERLRGPNYNTTTKQIVGAIDQFAKYYKVFNKDCSSIEVNIKFNSLQFINRANEKDGEVKITDTIVDYAIDYRPRYSDLTPSLYFRGTTVSVEGRITSPYIESTRIDFISSYISDVNKFIGWEIKIYRVTHDPTETDTSNSTFIDSISEIHSSKFSYPNSALISFNFDAEYFSQIPTRSYDTKLLKVKVPSNYDPIKKTYTGNWDGTFKADKTWSDNPAWCFYDLVTNSRYGLGKYIDSQFVDKWTLYEIGQYCDVLVPDGFGGIEPRFTCNLMLQSREEAYKVINDMASIFRGIAYYAAGNIYINQDNEKKNPIYQFTNANVEDGEFMYSSSSSKARRNVAIVRYNDKSNFYKSSIEYVEDVDGIRKNGIKESEVAAFGCTSRGQASRLGKWILFTENLETETVSFSAGLEANYLRPGDVISISDQNRNIRRRGGRLSDFNSTSKTVTLDSNLPGIDASKKYFLSILTPSFFYDTSIVDLSSSNDTQNIRRGQVQNFYLEGSQISVGDNSTVINLNPQFPDTTSYSLLTGAIWTLSVSGNEQGKAFPSAGTDFSDLNELSSRNETFRVLSVEESESNKYKVSAIEFNPLKFTAIESGLSFDSSYSNVIPSTAQSVGFNITSAGNSKIINYTINSNTSTQSLGALSHYLVFAKSSTLNVNPWKKGDYRENNPSLGGFDTDSIDTNVLLPDSRYKIGNLSAPNMTVVTSNFIPLDNNIYYFFKIFAANSSNATSDALSASTPLIQNNFPIKDIVVQNLRLSSDIISTNPAGQKNASPSIYSQESPTFNFNWSYNTIAGSIFASNFYYRISFRPKSANNAPATSKFFQVTGFLPNDSLNPNYTFSLLDNINSNGGTPLREYDVVVEAHDSNGNSSAGGNFLTSSDSDFTNSNGYDILTVNNPRITNILLNENNNCPAGAEYCTESFYSYEKEIKIHFTSIPSNFNDAAGGFVYVSENPFSTSTVEGKTIAQCNAAGVEVLEFKKFTNPIIVRPSSANVLAQSRKVYIAYNLYDSFDKQWSDLAPVKPKLEIYQKTSSVQPAIRPEIRSYGGEGYKAWLLIDLEAGIWKGFGIKSVVPIVLDSLNANHPYRLFKGFRKYRCDNRIQYTFVNDEWYDTSIEKTRYRTLVTYDKYCGYGEPVINAAGVFRADEAFPAAYTFTLSSLLQWVRFRCYFNEAEINVPYSKQSNGAPLVDAIYNSYSSQGTLYQGNYHVIGTNARNRDYRTMGDGIVNPIFNKIYSTPGNLSDNFYILNYFPYFDNNPEYNHHPAGFGQGFGGLEKNTKYFDIHMGRLVDHGFLTSAFFGVVWSNRDVQDTII
jgi:hypothetical protein